MRNYERRQAGFWISALLLVVLLLLAFITYNSGELHNPWIYFAVQNHTTIMLALVMISVAFGFSWAFMLYRQIESEHKASRQVTGLVMRFLSPEERRIVLFLVEKSGRSMQSDLSRLENMGKVKAFRGVRRLSEKGIVAVGSRGKARIVELNSEIFRLLETEIKAKPLLN